MWARSNTVHVVACLVSKVAADPDPTLSEDPCKDVHYWRDQSIKWYCDGWSDGVDYHHEVPQDWSPHPHQVKCCDAIKNGPHDGQGNPNNDHKYVVEDEFGVLVDDAQDFVQCCKGFGLLMLSEAVLEIKLDWKEAE